MPAQTYKINTPDATAGQLYGLQTTRADLQTRFNTGTAGIGFGVAVKHKSSNDSARGVELGGAENVYGISVRQVNREQEVKPGDGSVSFLTGEDLTVVFEGRVVVAIQDAVTPADHGDKLYVDDLGQFYVADPSANNAVQTTNVTVDVPVGSAANGDTLYSVVITNKQA